jgi:hypothetical protein
VLDDLERPPEAPNSFAVPDHRQRCRSSVHSCGDALTRSALSPMDSAFIRRIDVLAGATTLHPRHPV